MALSSTENSYTNFSYTGNIQSFTAPVNGIYKLECWGAGGTGGSCGKGGYSCGYKELKKGTVVYVCVGGTAGARYPDLAKDSGDGSKSDKLCEAGYNGGGTGVRGNSPVYSAGGGGGGGATHFASASGTLAALGSGQKNKIYIVAGGGGGGSYAYSIGNRTGGAGGGTNGGKGAGDTSSCTAANQSAGGSGAGSNSGSFGKGGNGTRSGGNTSHSGGGGGGLFGGNGGTSYYINSSSRGAGSAGGGSGYIGGVPSITVLGTTYNPTTTAGSGSARDTDGKAKVTFIKKTTLPINFNGTALTSIVYNGTTITSLIYNGTKLFFRKLFGKRKEAIA